MKKVIGYLKRYLGIWGSDYTITIYLAKIAGYIVTLIYFVVTFFDKGKTKEFNRTKNFFVLKRNELINKHANPLNAEFNKSFLKTDKYDFNGIYLPVIENTHLMRDVYEDSLKIYTEYNDNYNYTIVDEIEKTLPEGTYCYTGPNGEDITIKQGDVVFDAGAWIGDFAAYAAKKGAHAYAFEPSPANIKLLEKTVAYNSENGGLITIVPYGLGDKEDVLEFYENDDAANTGANSFNVPDGKQAIKLHITTVDTFVEKNAIPKVDFIKSDIEGYERLMLKGATKTLKEHQPILSICTYHYPDDPEVLKAIILEANPKYKILQRKKKLFAFVEK